MTSKPLTNQQRALLAELPDAPNDGRYCKGSRFRIAETLCLKGLARKVGTGLFVGGYFVRTDEGRAANTSREKERVL